MIVFPEQKNNREIQILYGKVSMIFKTSLEELINKKRILVYKQNDKIVGLLHISARYDKILMLVVDKKVRQKGIGKQLFEISKRLYNFEHIKILAMPLSISFWEKIGFKKTGKIKQTKHQILTEMVY